MHDDELWQVYSDNGTLSKVKAPHGKSLTVTSTSSRATLMYGFGERPIVWLRSCCKNGRLISQLGRAGIISQLEAM